MFLVGRVSDGEGRLCAGVAEQTCQSTACRPATWLQPRTAHTLTRLSHFCLISPHQKASICNADNVYFRKGGSESLDSFYNKMNGLGNFFQKTAPNLENFNDLYYSKL